MPTRLIAKDTSPTRRTAIQIAMMLPEDVHQAREVLDQANEILENFLVAGPRLLQKSNKPRRDYVPPPTCQRAVPFTLVIFGVTAAVGLEVTRQIGTPMSLGWLVGIGLLLVTVVAGRWFGVAYSLLYALLFNFLEVEPAFTLTWPTPTEIWRTIGWLAICLALPLILKHAYAIRYALTNGVIVARIKPPLDWPAGR